ncbi:transmembrane protein, putative [Medicago truncatula]|uniref:Transmembrane protein, putative n=1 Tax=Medicago truncatula TaxID=3880 RepID=G7KSG8_MEDTR|nr:transmembrane protein, putative [Medicago truncatula]
MCCYNFCKEKKKNLVPFKAVVKGVLLHRLVQAIAALILVTHYTCVNLYSPVIIVVHTSHL